MDSLIPIINKLQTVFSTIGGHVDEVQLPQIAVVGDQSTGKSSLIEGIVGRDFLPRGTGIVTRRPLLLHLIHTPLNDPKRQLDDRCATCDWVTFDHRPSEIFVDFEAVREEIEAETNRENGTNKCVSDKQIILKMYSENVVNLSLIDLPGIAKNPVGDQPRDIEAQIKSMIMHYIENPNCLILAVTPASQDFATSESLKLARDVDEDGNRTLCVLTKLDLMDKGTDAMEVLNGNVIPVKLGIIGVVNRSQADINDNKSIEECLEDEITFLHKKYPSVAEKNGIQFLAKRLNKLLMDHIRICLPKLKLRIAEMSERFQRILESCGQPVVDKKTTLLEIITSFSNAFTSTINGNPEELETKTLLGGARIAFIFHDTFHKLLEEIDPLGGLTSMDILTAIHNASGPRAPLVAPQTSFELLVKKQMRPMKNPSLKCVDLVHEELKRIAKHCGDELVQEVQRFPRVYDRINNVVTSLLNYRVQKTKKFVENLIKIQLAYINTKHPEFAEKSLNGLVKNNKDEMGEDDADTSINSESKNEWLDQEMSFEAMDEPGSDTTEAVRKSQQREPSQRDKRNTGIVEKFIRCYFLITRKSVEDIIPKAIMEFLVNHVRSNKLQNELIHKLYNDKDMDQLLMENKDVVHRRKAATEMLEALNKANDVISEVREAHLL